MLDNSWHPLIAAHEFGHMLGLYDEAEGNEEYWDENYKNWPAMGRPALPIPDDLSMMSRGGPVRDWHYDEILEWLISETGGRQLVLGNFPVASPGGPIPGLEEDSLPFSKSSVPTPPVIALMGLGLAGLGFARRRRMH